MATPNVAEGPLIKHVRGGFAEWRAKESGLPPARLRTSEGEWWGKLVGPADTLDVDAGIGGAGGTGVDTGDGDEGGGGYIGSNFTDEEMQGFDPAAFDETLRNKLNEEQRPDPILNPKIDIYERKTDYTPVDWDVNYNPMPQGYGWGVSTDSPILPYGQGSGTGGGGVGPSRGAVVPGGQGDWITTRGSAGLQKPLVDFKPSPTEYAKGYDPDKRFVEKLGVVNKAVEDLKDVATDGLKLGEKWITAITGPTAGDLRERGDYLPRNPKEKALFNKFKKGYEIFIAAIKEGGGVFGGTLYETGGGRTTMPDTKTGEVPQAHFPNILKTLIKVFAGEKDPIVMQEYGDMHWPTILATIGMANTYGPIVWAIPGLRTMAETIGASMNGMLMDKPNLEGNPIQDTMHRLFWIAGQAGQKVYEISVGKIIKKLRGTPKSEKTRGTISEELNDLFSIKDAFKDHKIRRIKVSGDVKAAGEKHLQPSPAKTITGLLGEPPQGEKGIYHQPPRSGVTPPSRKQEEKTTETKIEELADVIMGEIPTGKKFDPNYVDPDAVDPDAVRSKTERKFTKEEREEFNRQQKQREQSEQDKREKERRDKFFEDAEPPPEMGTPKVKITKPTDKKYKIQFGDGSVHEVNEEIYLRETTPDENGVSNARPYIDPETLKELEDLGIKPDDDPTNPYANYLTRDVKVAVDQSGLELDHTAPGFDKSRIAGFEYKSKQFPNRGKDDPKAGSEEANHRGEITDLESEWQSQQKPSDTGQTGTGLQDFRSDYQKELGLTVGNEWANESDRSTWSAIKATQTPHLNPKGGADLWYNKALPSSNLEDHPQYYGNNPESHLNVEPDVNVEYIPAGDKDVDDEIFNWSSKAGLHPTITKPIYSSDYQFMGEEVFVLEAESYQKGDGWGYRYRYNNAGTGGLGEWHEWTPGP